MCVHLGIEEILRSALNVSEMVQSVSDTSCRVSPLINHVTGRSKSAASVPLLKSGRDGLGGTAAMPGLSGTVNRLEDLTVSVFRVTCDSDSKFVAAVAC